MFLGLRPAPCAFALRGGFPPAPASASALCGGVLSGLPGGRKTLKTQCVFNILGFGGLKNIKKHKVFKGFWVWMAEPSPPGGQKALKTLWLF